MEYCSLKRNSVTIPRQVSFKHLRLSSKNFSLLAGGGHRSLPWNWVETWTLQLGGEDGVDPYDT